MRTFLPIILRDSDRARFEAIKLRSSRNGECLEWGGQRNRYGYGVFKIIGRRYLANRVAAVIAGIPLTQNLCACHRCDNPACINPDHLFAGTDQQNVRDMIAKGRRVLLTGDDHPSRKDPSRLARGSQTKASKLNEAKVAEIKSLLRSGRTRASIAPLYGVTRSNIDAIANGLTWNHVQ